MDWRYMLGVEAIPSIFFLLSIIKIPESPRWLILFAQKEDKAQKILNIMYSGRGIKQKIEEIKLGLKQNNQSLFSKNFSKQLKLAFLISFFNQLSGINFVLASPKCSTRYQYVFFMTTSLPSLMLSCVGISGFMIFRFS